MSKKTDRAEAREHALRNLAQAITKGSTLYCILRHEAQSGATVVLTTYVIASEPLDVTERVASALGLRYDERRRGLILQAHPDTLAPMLAGALFGVGSTDLKAEWL